MAIYALISGGTVRNIIAADPGFTLAGYDLVDLTGIDPRPEKGWTWDGSAFAAGARPVPQTITRHQLRVALHQAGLLGQVEALMSDPDTDPIAVLAWQDAVEFQRNSPTIAGMAGALGLGDDQIDDLFREAAKIEA